jgi:hypothetical protein
MQLARLSCLASCSFETMLLIEERLLKKNLYLIFKSAILLSLSKCQKAFSLIWNAKAIKTDKFCISKKMFSHCSKKQEQLIYRSNICLADLNVM